MKNWYPTLNNSLEINWVVLIIWSVLFNRPSQKISEAVLIVRDVDIFGRILRAAEILYRGFKTISRVFFTVAENRLNRGGEQTIHS